MKLKSCPDCNYANNQASETCSQCGFVFSPDTDVISDQSQEVLSKCPHCGHTSEERLDTCPACNKSLQVPWYDNLLIKVYMRILDYSKEITNMSHGKAVFVRDTIKFLPFIYFFVVIVIFMNLPPLPFSDIIGPFVSVIYIGFGAAPPVIMYYLYHFYIKKKYRAIFDEELLDKEKGKILIYGQELRKD
ncbi:MAG: hypothetical protein ACXACK_18750 [Candidatus Hodarchaeales archaeon]|jgi:RNA polymerase subunit RPABC4/transcription elongation factor Spt4